jgi:hypothetical protein
MSADNVIDCGGSPRCGYCRRCRQLKQSTSRLAELAPLVQPGPAPVSFSMNNDAQGDRERRRRAADRVLEQAGLKPRPL